MEVKKEIKVGTDFSGIGSPEQALKELGIEHIVEFACEKDKYARETYLANHSAKIMYDDITTRDNSKAPYVDLYCFGFPCQAFSISGKRKGFDDVRGTLFFNAAEYIKEHRPQVFIAENVKGLLSHDKPKNSKSKHGRTFSTIINILAKTVNGQILMPMYEDNLGYNVYYTVLNSKHYDVPQNRERIFIVGFRDDVTFNFPTSKTVTKRLADILESEVDEKYYLSEKIISYFLTRKDNFNAGKINYKPGNDLASTITKSSSSIDISDNIIIEGEVTPNSQAVTPNSQAGKVYRVDGVSPTISAGTHGYALGYIQEPVCAAMRGRGEQGNINQQLEQRTDGVTNTITSVQKDNLIIIGNIDGYEQDGRIYSDDGICPTIDTMANRRPHIQVKEATKKGYAVASEGDSINLSVPNSKTRRGRVGVGVAQTLDTQCNQAVVVNNDKLLVVGNLASGYESNGRVYSAEGISKTINAGNNGGGEAGQRTGIYQVSNRIRRLTPLECMRLQGFPDEFIKPCSDTQTYKQAGNSITVNVIKAILKNIKF